MPSVFLLIGIPGLQKGAIWTSILFCVLYVLASLGNGILLYVIKTEKSLHTPMYFFLSMLAINDLAFPSSTVPKTLVIFWFNDGLIDATSCLTQMFFVHCLSVIESGILASMAYDRFMAICSPLRYNSVLTSSLLVKVAFGILARAVLIILPVPILAGRVKYCGDNIVLHSYCDHMAVVDLACGDTRADSFYGLALGIFITGFDLLFIGLSYAMILRAIFNMSSREARHKAVGTCGSHICVILSAYLPAIFSFVTYRFGEKSIPRNVHIFLANIYIVFPSFMNPFIYGVRTKEIRQRVWNILTHNINTFRFVCRSLKVKFHKSI
uniref:Olfactory receptor n=2 Tax=Pyxicephalus adspersus TaxID=30357 RepID=A0AAV3B0J3_PYXAD|nr:TPA: hypothetical protein GDO54_000077 [Pyxicephalus adspersus]